MWFNISTLRRQEKCTLYFSEHFIQNTSSLKTYLIAGTHWPLFQQFYLFTNHFSVMLIKSREIAPFGGWVKVMSLVLSILFIYL